MQSLYDQVIHISAVACGNDHTLALTNKGSIFSWGSSREGQTGHGDRKDQLLPKLIQTDKIFTQISCGPKHSLPCIQLAVIFK